MILHIICYKVKYIIFSELQHFKEGNITTPHVFNHILVKMFGAHCASRWTFEKMTMLEVFVGEISVNVLTLFHVACSIPLIEFCHIEVHCNMSTL